MMDGRCCDRGNRPITVLVGICLMSELSEVVKARSGFVPLFHLCEWKEGGFLFECSRVRSALDAQSLSASPFGVDCLYPQALCWQLKSPE